MKRYLIMIGVGLVTLVIWEMVLRPMLKGDSYDMEDYDTFYIKERELDYAA